MAETPGLLSLGIAAAVGAELAVAIAPAVEDAGFHALWVNDTPGADALALLAAVAQVTDRLVLATGVLPVDRHTPGDILARIDELGLPSERLVLGIGSGALAVGALDAVESAAGALGEGSDARVLVGALGPRMRRVGARASDGLLLSWLTPAVAAAQTREAHELSPGAHIALYVRAAVDPAATPRLSAETARYASFPRYAANFERLGIPAGDTTIAPGTVGDRIGAYRGSADEVVLRAITPGESAEDYLRFIDETAATATATTPTGDAG